MELQAVHRKILAYLQRHSPVNTFRLSRHLEIDRGKLIDIIKDLTEQGLTRFEHGSVSIIEMSEIAKGAISHASAQSKQMNASERSELAHISPISEHAQKPKVFDKRNQILENKEEKPADLSKPSPSIAKSKILKKKKRHKKVRVKKKAKKIRTRKVLGKEKQEALNQWVRLATLDIEKLKIEIKLLSLSPNPEEMERLRDSITKLRDLIDQKIREKLLISSSNYFRN